MSSMQPKSGSGLARSDTGARRSGAGSPIAVERRGVGDGSSAVLGCGRRTARRRREVGAADGSAVAWGRGRLVGGASSARRWRRVGDADGSPTARGHGCWTPRWRREVRDAEHLGGGARSQLARTLAISHSHRRVVRCVACPAACITKEAECGT
jgi:hypothetical protein